jgi:hypothetical protein
LLNAAAVHLEVTMRPRTLIDVREDGKAATPVLSDTYDRVRRTLDDALAELELPADSDEDNSAPIRL